MKRQLRAVIANLLYFSGLLWLIAEFRLRRRAVVLMYHRVLPPGSDTFSHDGIIVSPDTFERHMRFLRRHFRPLTPEQFALELTNSTFGRRACLVTFDDGWYDTYLHALPVLERTQVPAVVFVATAYLGTQRVFWQERLTRLLFHSSRIQPSGDDPIAELGGADIRLLGHSQAKARVRELVSQLKCQEQAVIDNLMSRLVALSGKAAAEVLTLGDDRFLSWEEAVALCQSDFVTVGSHAHTHTPLPKLGVGGAQAELALSRDQLVLHGMPRPRVCAYPNGDVDDIVEHAARDAGFTLGFATGHGRVGKGDNPMRLPRVNIHDRSSRTNAEFLCLILGVM